MRMLRSTVCCRRWRAFRYIVRRAPGSPRASAAPPRRRRAPDEEYFRPGRRVTKSSSTG
jgi:hypothetical protein